MPTVTSSNRDEFISNEMAKKKVPKAKKNPSEMTNSQLEKHLEKARATSSSLNSQLIEAKLGTLRHSELMQHEHPLAKTYQEHSPWQESLMSAIRQREEAKGIKTNKRY